MFSEFKIPEPPSYNIATALPSYEEAEQSKLEQEEQVYQYNHYTQYYIVELRTVDSFIFTSILIQKSCVTHARTYIFRSKAQFMKVAK